MCDAGGSSVAKLRSPKTHYTACDGDGIVHAIARRLYRQVMANQSGPRSFAYLALVALLVLLATLWSASYTFIKLGVESSPSVTFIAARTTIAAVVLVGILRWRSIPTSTTMPNDFAVWRRINRRLADKFSASLPE